MDNFQTDHITTEVTFKEILKQDPDQEQHRRTHYNDLLYARESGRGKDSICINLSVVLCSKHTEERIVLYIKSETSIWLYIYMCVCVLLDIFPK